MIIGGVDAKLHALQATYVEIRGKVRTSAAFLLCK